MFAFRGWLIAFLFISLEVQLQAERADLRVNLGTLEVYVLTDLRGKECRTEYQVLSHGRRFKIHFRRADRRELGNGSSVSFTGKKLRANKLIVGSSAKDFQVLRTARAEASVIGVRSLLVLRIQSNTAVTSSSELTIASVMGQVHTHYQEYTYQQLGFTNDRDGDAKADVYTVTINQDTTALAEAQAFTVCESAITNAKTQHGITAANWQHIICVLPPDMAYSWFGSAYMPGNKMVINGNHAGHMPDGYAHEIGHNLGMNHANSNPPLPGTEYGDSSCVMGGSASTSPRHFNGPHMVQMGWLSPTTVFDAGTYELNALEVQPGARLGNATVLKVRDSVASQDLYISYRAAIGSFSSGPINPLKTAVHLHSGGSALTMILKTLNDGESFTQNGIVVTQLAHTASTATVQVTLPCTANPPQISVIPSSQNGVRNSPVSYTLQVLNQDTLVCGTTPTAFTVAATPGAGVTATVNPASLSVSPGQAGTVTLTVTAGASVPTGVQKINVTASALGHTSSGATASLVLDVFPPNAPSNLRNLD